MKLPGANNIKNEFLSGDFSDSINVDALQPGEMMMCPQTIKGYGCVKDYMQILDASS